MSSHTRGGQLLAAAAIAITIASCGAPGTGARERHPLASPGAAAKDASLLPDPRLTPGDTLDVSRDDVCTPGYSSRVRDVPIEVKKQVYAEYGIASHRPHEYEIDHLISLELGGSNSVRNLWPQSYLTRPWNAHVKDHLENELHRKVCDGEIDRREAQREIATDWIAAYRREFHTDRPLADSSGNRSDSSALDRSGAVPRVWVNTRSGAYWLPGTRYYGRTKEGQFMSEQEAVDAGFHPAGRP